MRRLLFKAEDLNAPVSSSGYEDGDAREIAHEDEANLVSSHLEDEEGPYQEFLDDTDVDVDESDWPLPRFGDLHAPVIDLDRPHRYVASSTPGHGHLYLDTPMTWDQYVDILKALAAAGVIEDGFYENTLRRGAGFVRRPGVAK